MGDLNRVYLCQKIGLIFLFISCRGEINFTIPLGRRSIMAGSRFIERMPPTLLKETEFDHFVTHHIGIRG